MATAETLKIELETYESNKASLMEHEGKYVLIQGREISGIWGTYEDALQAGYQKFGLKPFLVKKIQGIECIQHFSRDLCPR